MIAVIKPSAISGAVQAPASKSSMQRACAAALLARGRSVIGNPGHSNDDKAAVEIINGLGADVKWELPGDPFHKKLIVESGGIRPVAVEIDCGESGLSIRMFTPIAALSEKEIRITGRGSLVSRPMEFFDEILPQLNVQVRSNAGKLPIIVKGPLQPRNIEIDGSLSSQFLTGLLMAYGAAAAFEPSRGPVCITVKHLTSKPYIDLTLDVMKRFGLPVPENKNYEQFIFPFPHRTALTTHNSPFPTHNYTVESDWSGGAFLLVAGAIAGPVTIRGLDLASTQADRAILTALSAAQASFAIEAKGIKVRPAPMKAFEFDANDSPDLFPPLAALAAYCDGTSAIKGVGRLAHKESNRTVALQSEFGKMGVKIEIAADVMLIHGPGQISGNKIHSHHDHRIAMACAIAGLRASGETVIEEADAVKKSYPDFYDDLKRLGADVSLNPKIKFHE